MGCVWSRGSNSERSSRVNQTRRLPERLPPRYQTYILPSSSELLVLRPQPKPATPPEPRFGQYRCTCGRSWNSRLSWQGKHQLCKGCKKPVRPHALRELRPSDMTSDVNVEHPKELCQKCKELGSYCGKKKRSKSLVTNSRRHGDNSRHTFKRY